MSKIKILVVDDEKNIVELLKINLERYGYDVISAYTGMEAITLTSTDTPDLILLDVMLPDSDGIKICSMIRSNEKTSDIPIIMVSAKSEEEDKIEGLIAGADDYITKPFSIKEIEARIQSVLRRSKSNAGEKNKLSIEERDKLYINKDKYEVLVGGLKADLTLSEFKLLSKIFENPNKVYTREELMDVISSDKDKTDIRTIDVHIRNIRKKIEIDGDEFIETVRGIGYRVK